MYCPQTLNSNVSVYKYSSSKSSPTWRAQYASGLLWNLALYLVLKFTLSLQSSILMSSEFFAYLAVVQPLSTYPSFYLFNPSGLWSPGTPWTLSEWTTWGIVAYRGIILLAILSGVLIRLMLHQEGQDQRRERPLVKMWCGATWPSFCFVL